MRTELDEARQIDQYLFRQLNQDDTREFETRLLLNETLAAKVDAQRTAHRLIRLYARTQERNRLQEIYRNLLTEKNFADQLKNIFA
jgi:DNA-binding transcriptional regulator YbjK